MPLTNLLGLSLVEIQALVAERGEKPFRANQLYSNIYHLHRTKLEEMSDLSKSFRAQLATAFEIRLPQVLHKEHASDGTEKFLLRLHDGETVEMVHIPEPRRNTLCISTQVGCNAGCRYCVTATMGLRRNLTAAEIVGQVMLCELLLPGETKSLNLVYMGMGEPLLNYDATMRSLQLLADPKGMSISPRRITLSTCGVVPGLERLAQEKVIPRLAVSLGAPTDELRGRLIPLNRKWNLDALLEACRAMPIRDRITFEYTLIRGINDSPLLAKKLVKLLHGLRTKINLIPLNPHPLLPYERPDPNTILAFQEILIHHGLSAFIRQPRGDDISAACGQLVVAASTTHKDGSKAGIGKRLPA
jgi:23S rRNA (adenine2503-C2)-methyltransferase